MTVCTAGQLPFSASGASTPGALGTGETELAACVSWADAWYGVGNHAVALVDGRCANNSPVFGTTWADLTVVCTVGAPPSEDDPLMTICNGACTVTHVVSIDMPPLQLETADGALIAGAILAVWVVGWAFRVLIRTLRIDGDSSSTSESEN